MYRYDTMENGSRQQAHNAQASTHTSERPPVLSGSHYSVCVTLPGIPGVDAICRQYIGYTRVASNFYHDLIDRFSMSGALLFTFLLDSRGGTVVTETKGASSLSPLLLLLSGHIYVYANL
jgi:hypothetical protein